MITSREKEASADGPSSAYVRIEIVSHLTKVLDELRMDGTEIERVDRIPALVRREKFTFGLPFRLEEDHLHIHQSISQLGYALDEKLRTFIRESLPGVKLAFARPLFVTSLSRIHQTIFLELRLEQTDVTVEVAAVDGDAPNRSPCPLCIVTGRVSYSTDE